MLLKLGLHAHLARVGPGLWTLPTDSNSIRIRVIDDGRVAFSTRLVEVPKANHAPFYRYLLTANDSIGPLGAGIAGGVVILVYIEPIEYLNRDEVSSMLFSLARVAEVLRAQLMECFGAERVAPEATMAGLSVTTPRS